MIRLPVHPEIHDDMPGMASLGASRSRTMKNAFLLLGCAVLCGCANRPDYTYTKTGNTYTLVHRDRGSDSTDCRAFAPGYSAGQRDLFEQRVRFIRAKIDEAHAQGHACTLTEDEYQRTFGKPYAAPDSLAK